MVRRPSPLPRLKTAVRGLGWVVFVAVSLGFTISSSSLAQQAPAKTPAKTLRVGVEPTAEPFTFVDAQGKPVGFSIDLLQAIADEQGFEIEWVVRPWTEVLSLFRAGDIDLVANVAYLPERVGSFAFTIPHASMPGAVFLNRNSEGVRSFDDLNEKAIAVGEESVGHQFARRHALTKNLVFVNSLRDALMHLDRGKVEAVFASEPIGRRLVNELGLNNVYIGGLALPPFVFDLHLAVQPNNTDLLYRLNLGIHQLHENGTYDQLYEKWLGPLGARPIAWRDVQPFWWFLFLVVLVIAAVFVRQRQLLARLRIQAEALRHSEEQLSLALEGSQEAFWDWDLQAQRVMRSPRWAEILGCDPNEIAPQIDALNPSVHPEDLPRVQACKRQMLLRFGKVEYRVRSKDGTWRWIFDRGSVVARNADGQPLRVTGVATDITASKQTEAELARSKKLLEQAQETAQIGGWEYDLRTGTMYWTEQAYRIHELDASSANLSLDRVVHFFTPTAQPTIKHAFEKALRDGTPFDLELEMVTAKSRLVWLRTSGRADWDGGSVVRLHGAYQDISKEKQSLEERQKLQLKMLEAQKLESLGVLAGGIAHDFNNLLTVILGNTSLAREHGGSIPEALDQIEIASQRAADLCRQMLAYAGKSRFNVEVIDLNKVVTDTVQLLRLSISKSAKLDFVFCPKPLPVDADPSQIRQVVMNLVINASEALGGDNGNIRISTTQVVVTRELLKEARLGQDLPAGEYVAFEIADEGCGMSQETLSRIFDPFFTTKFTGRGLGLAAVVGVIRAHRGALFVSSLLGRGTTFRILLPRSTQPASVAPAPLPRSTQRVKVDGALLVVDDEPNVRRVASAILERHGYTVAVASDGYEALALGLAHGGKFTAVLLDLTMPGLDGPSTLKELRAMNPSLPVLLMSGFSEDDARKRIPSDNLTAFLPKPFTADDLLRALEALLTRTKAGTATLVR